MECTAAKWRIYSETLHERWPTGWRDSRKRVSEVCMRDPVADGLSKLDAHQIADLQRVLRGKPSDVGLSGNLWDGKTMSAYLRNKHRVQLGPRQCRRLLREWEFRYRKPRPVIARSDPLKQAAHKKTPPPGQR